MCLKLLYINKKASLSEALVSLFSRFYLIFNITPLLAGICSVNFSSAQSF